MNKFVASNGKRIETLEDGQIAIVQPIPGSPMEHRTWAGPDDAQALREFFLAERDAELGRWRSKEHPEYVVYPNVGVQSVYVYCEICPQDGEYVTSPATGHALAEIVAREFFAAHPEPKPWHDAQPGEVWLLEVLGLEDEFLRVQYRGERWLNAHTGLVVAEAENATAGRRIWPEVQL